RTTPDTWPDRWVPAPSNEQLRSVKPLPAKINKHNSITMQTRTIEMELKGKACSRSVPVSQTLASLLREGFGLSTSISCGEGNCGTCSVLVDGQPVRSCLMLAVQASGHVVTSLEGLADQLPRLQKAFAENHAIQCGYCAPGFMIASAALLCSNSKPSEA